MGLFGRLLGDSIYVSLLFSFVFCFVLSVFVSIRREVGCSTVIRHFLLKEGRIGGIRTGWKSKICEKFGGGASRSWWREPRH